MCRQRCYFPDTQSNMSQLWKTNAFKREACKVMIFLSCTKTALFMLGLKLVRKWKAKLHALPPTFLAIGAIILIFWKWWESGKPSCMLCHLPSWPGAIILILIASLNVQTEVSFPWHTAGYVPAQKSMLSKRSVQSNEFFELYRNCPFHSWTEIGEKVESQTTRSATYLLGQRSNNPHLR